MTVPAHAIAEVNADTRRLASVFAVLWAFANVAHLLNQTRGDLAIVSWINLGFALWLIARPGSAHRLALLAGAQLLDTGVMAPYAPDHQLLAAFVNVTVLATYLAAGRPSSAAAVVERVSPAARVILLVAYSAAAVSKYNSDFLTPAQSCASFMANTSSFELIGRGSPLAVGYVAITIASETLIPILLLVPATRRWGVLFACTFHFFVSLSPVIGVNDFTTTLWALLILFLPAGDVDEIGNRIRGGLNRSPVISAIRKAPNEVVVGAGLLAVLGGSVVADGAFVYLTNWLLVTTLGVTLLVCMARVLRGVSRRASSLGSPSLGQVLVILALVALVTGPYLGFGTSSRFTMFSGLRTEGTGTNHLFLPSVHLIDSQSDYLIVLDSHGDSRTLDIAAEHHAALPLAEIHRILQDDEISATFQQVDGREIVVKAGQDHPLRESPRWWEAKTQHYRPFTVKGETRSGFCSN